MSGAAAVWLARDARAVFGSLRLGAGELGALARQRLSDLLVAATAAPWHSSRIGTGRDLWRFVEREPERVLAALPPLCKQEIRSAGNNALRHGRVERHWYSSRSSGSTGEPFRVFYDARSWATLKYLVKLRARGACGVRSYHRIALLDAFSPAEEGRTMPERLGRVRRISVLRPAEEVARLISAFQPDAIYGLPSALLEAGVHEPQRNASTGLIGVFTSGELLSPAARATLERLYRARVFDVYGTSETKEIAWECRAGASHINSDVVWLEILNESGEALPCGEEGEIVVTLLVNHAMPLLRYRTGDRGAVRPGVCSCGSALPLLGVVSGRSADTIEFGPGARVASYAFTCALEGVGGLSRYQVRQLAPDALHVLARPLDGADPNVLCQAIRDAIQAAVPWPLRVEVSLVCSFCTGPGAKFRVVEPLPRPGAGVANPA